MYVDQNPRLQQICPLKISTEYEPYEVEINDVVLSHCTIKKIVVEPNIDRKVMVSLQVNTLLEDDFAAPLAKAKQEDVRFSMRPAQVDVEDPEARELDEAA